MLHVPKIIGHRGAASYAPENTLASLRAAAAKRLSWVEVDVMLSADDVPVLCHDHELDRTTNGMGLVHDYTFAELQALDAGGWFAPQYKGESIPSLQQVCALAHELNLGLNLDIKAYPGLEEATMNAVARAIATLPSALPLLLSSFEIACVQMAKRRLSQIPRGLISDDMAEESIDIARQEDCYSLHVAHNTVTDHGLETCHRNNIKVFAYTVNDLSRAQILWRRGVDSVFSDNLVSQ